MRSSSVVLETDFGLLVVDVPAAQNHLVQLCHQEYFRNTLLFRVERDFVCGWGDPTGTGTGGDFPAVEWAESDWRGTVLFRAVGSSSSAMFLSLSDGAGPRYSHLRDGHVVVGKVVEDVDGVVAQLNALAGVDDKFRPLLDVRVRRSAVLATDLVLEDRPPFRDVLLDCCPEEWDRIEERPSVLRLTTGAEPTVGREALLAETNAIKLEILGDLANADAGPEDKALFVCKLNPITTSNNLGVIFSKFGEVVDCEVKRDLTTGQSLQYAFVHFATRESCDEAYRKMQNVMIDGRRVKVDFSQSQGRKRGAVRVQSGSGSSSVLV